MIVVTVGASQFPFDRLLHAVDALELDEELVVQHGASAARPRAARCKAFMPRDELAGHIRNARAVVSHGGIGSVLTALAEGKRPLVIPRLARYGETVDDHQVESTRRLATAGLVTPVYDPADLAGALEATASTEAVAGGNGGGLAGDLRAFIESAVRGAQ